MAKFAALVDTLLILTTAVPAMATSAAGAPSLRNGRPGSALKDFRRIEVATPLGSESALRLQPNMTTAGVPAHLHWVDGRGLSAVVPPAAWVRVEVLLKGFEVTVVSEDVQEQLEAEKAERIKYPFARGQMENNTFYSAWRTLDEIDEHMDWLRETAPFGLDIDDIVVGETNEGRPIRGVRMSSPRGPGTEELPKVFMHGCHHSGEWITAMGTVYFFEQLVTGYASDAEITALLERFEWILVPVVNVDGFEFGWSNDAFRTWRKTRSVHPENLAAFAECELTTPGNCEGCFGTDPNRNWDFQWATVGASANPCSNSYHGPSAFSEAETVAVSEFARELNTGDRTLALYIDHHCCGDMYLQPYGALPELPVHHAAIDELGAIGKAATDAKCSTGSSPGTSPSGCDYRQGPIYTTIYPASGSSVDYMYAVNDIIYSYGTEMRSSNGNGPADPVLPGSEEMWAGVRAMALELIKDLHQ